MEQSEIRGGEGEEGEEGEGEGEGEEGEETSGMINWMKQIAIWVLDSKHEIN